MQRALGDVRNMAQAVDLDLYEIERTKRGNQLTFKDERTGGTVGTFDNGQLTLHPHQ